MRLSLLLIPLLLAGCAYWKPATTTARVPVTLPPQLLQPCEPLPQLTGNTWTGVLEHYGMVVELYATCRARHRALSDAAQSLTTENP